MEGGRGAPVAELTNLLHETLAIRRLAHHHGPVVILRTTCISPHPAHHFPVTTSPRPSPLPCRDPAHNLLITTSCSPLASHHVASPITIALS